MKFDSSIYKKIIITSIILYIINIAGLYHFMVYYTQDLYIHSMQHTHNNVQFFKEQTYSFFITATILSSIVWLIVTLLILKILKANENTTKQLEQINSSLDRTIEDKTEAINNLLKTYDTHVIASKTDLKGVITYASKAYEMISGYSQEELIGKSHSIARHPDTPKEVFKELWDTIQSGQTWRGEIKNLAKNGEN